MREIKFRAWDKVNKKMSSPFTPYEIADTDCDEDDITWLEKLYNLDDGYPIMQYTGLKDKNGKEIYEGDILIQYPGFGCEFKSRLGFVEYEFTSFWLRHKGYSNVLDDHDCQLEIIGNIHEHPHLLEKTNERVT